MSKSQEPLSHGAQAYYRLSRFSTAYRGRLLAGLQDVHAFCRESMCLPLKEVLKRHQIADKLLGQYVIERHRSTKGKALSQIKHALLGCQHLAPQLRGKLMTAWQNVKVWEEEKSSHMRPPLPLPIWVCMVGVARGRSIVVRGIEKSLWCMLAVLLEIGFLCMLRPGELLKLRHDDISLPGDYNLSNSQAAICVTSPKNRRQFGEHQFVCLQNANTIAWLRDIHIENSKEKLWPSSRGVFVRMFKQITTELDITSCGFSPASLRPGGATMFFSRGTSIPVLRFMGRWTVEKSLEHYIQQAMATQILNKLSPTAISRLRKLGSLCTELTLHSACDLIQPFKRPSKGNVGASFVAWCEKYAKLDSRAREEDCSRRCSKWPNV